MKNSFLLCLFVLFGLSAHAKIEGRYTVPASPMAKPVPQKGSLEKVRIVEVFSFTCPHCNNLHKKMPSFLKKFGDKVEVVPYEIGWIGPNPGKFYYLADSIGKGEKARTLIFAAYHDSNIKTINSPRILKFFAGELGISNEFKADFDDRKWFNLFIERQKYISSFNVESTPTFVIEDSLVAKGDLGNLEKIVNSLLKDPVR